MGMFTSSFDMKKMQKKLSMIWTIVGTMVNPFMLSYLQSLISGKRVADSMKWESVLAVGFVTSCTCGPFQEYCDESSMDVTGETGEKVLVPLAQKKHHHGLGQRLPHTPVVLDPGLHPVADPGPLLAGIDPVHLRVAIDRHVIVIEEVDTELTYLHITITERQKCDMS